MVSKEYVAKELKRRDPSCKANSKNKTVPLLMKLLVKNPLVDNDDIDFIESEYYRMTIVVQNKIDQDSLEKDADKHSRADKMVRLKFIVILTSNEEILAAYRRHTDTKTATETDYRNSDKAPPDWKDLMCIVFNECDEDVMTQLKPSLHDDFKEQIVCAPNENFRLTPEKCDEIMSTMKKKVRNITHKYNRSGNGSDMANFDGDTDDEAEAEGNDSDGENEAVYGRFNRARSIRRAQRRGITLIDGDDRKSFLKQEG